MPEETIPSLQYATPTQRPSGRIWASALILLGGLALVGFGGCFCIAIMMIVERTGFNGQPTTLPISSGDRILLIVFGALAAACFVTAIMLIYLGTKALLRIARS